MDAFDKQNATVASIYDSLASSYEQFVVPLYRPIARRLLQFIDLRPGWKVLDAGTGTGLVALMGAPRVGRNGKMIGVDASEGMLEIARRKASQFGFTQCEFRQGDIQALEFQDGQFDACLSEFALHYTDPSKSLRELHRALSPEGTFVFQAWADDSSEPHKALWDVLPKYRSTQTNDVLTASRAQSEHSNRFRKQFGAAEQLKELASAVGFSNVETHEEIHRTRVANVSSFLSVANASPGLHVEIAAMEEGVRQEFINEATAALERFETANGFEWSFNVLAVVARK